jgi:predicted O-methyltransferase YrrM
MTAHPSMPGDRGTKQAAGAAMDARLLELARACKGFLDEEEGVRLFELARTHAGLGPVVEIGSYCGKSSIYLGAGVREAGGLLVCVDHHRGSEEHQPGEGYHDPELYDDQAGAMDTLFELRRNLHEAGLEATTVVMVAGSTAAARVCADGLGMVFIDGGHSSEAANADYEAWAHKVAPGGILAIHDLFPDPSEGGQAPIEIYRRALASGAFDELGVTKTLGALKRR